jgi:transposase-like protein
MRFLNEGPAMRRHKAEEIVAKLRQVEGLAASGKRISECVREIGVTEVTYYRWRNRYGGLESDLAEHLTELEAEIARLRRLVSDLTLDKLILAEATAGALSPELRAAYVLHARAAFGVSERRACQALGQHRSTQRKIRARLSLEAPPAAQGHSADARSPSANLPDRRTTLRDSVTRVALDSTRGEGADNDAGFVTYTRYNGFGRLAQSTPTPDLALGLAAGRTAAKGMSGR